MATNEAKVLIIRFSSFGDIVQAMSAPTVILQQWADARADWLVRSDFASLLRSHPHVNRVISFERRDGLSGLFRLGWELSKQEYTHIYDAHLSLRSRLICWVIKLFILVNNAKKVNFTSRPKDRLKRFLLFFLRVNLFPQPFRGVHSFLEPLRKWGLQIDRGIGPHFWVDGNKDLPDDFIHFFSNGSTPIAIAPSAAWGLKRWPIENWRQLIQLLPEERFLVLGGPEDHFCRDLAAVSPDRVLNCAGRASLQQSALLISRSWLTISGDTGLLHVADQMEKPCIALIGPTAFGYPSGARSVVLEVDLKCKPCSKDGSGKCSNRFYQKCLTSITPAWVADTTRRLRKKVSS
jgi:heptosyltransferase-2